MSDIEIAYAAKKKPIIELCEERFGIPKERLEPYGHHKAKYVIDEESLKSDLKGNLILVSAISPTPAGEGKTTTTVGLGDALNRIGKKTIICLREPSLGPCFGIKGGAAGGGYAQVVPMEDINLHFTGDFHAITAAHNLLAAMIDNHIHHGNALDIDSRAIVHKRVLDMNDRSLRSVVVGMGGAANGFLREDGFDITVASEVMAIFCLAESIADLKNRLGKIVVAYTKEKKRPVLASELNAHGAMTALLKDALNPNIVQTLENNLAFIHGGPFANIAHGCNSIIATKTALGLADYVVTEAGFGADLGAEKFVDIKCRIGKLKPAVVVLVATIRALKYHGGLEIKDLAQENLSALEKGFVNLERHIDNVRNKLGLNCVVAINHFSADSEAEINLLKDKVLSMGVEVSVAHHWADGGLGAEDLATKVVESIASSSSKHRYLYTDDVPIWGKIEAVAKNIYRASGITADRKVRDKIEALQKDHGQMPICIAKTQMSFSTDPTLRGAPSGHVLDVREVKVAAGAGFIIVIAGNIMTMPGLPKIPSAERIDVSVNGKISGLF